ncbi:NifB/NifX family molybdenum-iron cluster-binding protein [Synoicihabitans lomoniglobus]|uniref:NifB/NifX family molybdenum-iron cluster-binding protein n=1 Tax=Synoicihabitans lomoniglobus TaxID=2909285 RepID=A0AAE9ZXL4_9BACT|nr:hypothetical protein [Opitutaceae bacterium LMO-M01]WED64780.1 NifB/NifX family molybdenum-iron cluster-binding protein [Opitutaceae bacterium LMO-M01]
MKIAIACNQSRLSGEVAPKFGRAPFYMIYDTENAGLSKLAKGPRKTMPPDGGLNVAVTLMETEIGAVIAGEFGDHVAHFFRGANVKLARAPGVGGSRALDDFLNGRLPSA